MEISWLPQASLIRLNRPPQPGHGGSSLLNSPIYSDSPFITYRGILQQGKVRNSKSFIKLTSVTAGPASLQTLCKSGISRRWLVEARATGVLIEKGQLSAYPLHKCPLGGCPRTCPTR